MTTALAEAPKPQLQMSKGWMQPSNMDEAYRLAKAIVHSGLAPRSFQTAESILIAIQLGGELGLKPMQSLQTIMVTNGRPSVWGNGLQGLCLASGQLEDVEEWHEGEGDDRAAYCKVMRKGIKTPKVGKFSVADAKRAGLMNKQTYQQYPDDMLMSKARARAYKLFSDVLCGLPVYEDIQDVVVEEPRRDVPPPAGDDPLLKKIGTAPEVIDVTPTKSEEPTEPAPSAPPAEPVKTQPPVEQLDCQIAAVVSIGKGKFKVTTSDNDVLYVEDQALADFLKSCIDGTLTVHVNYYVDAKNRWQIEQAKSE